MDPRCHSSAEGGGIQRSQVTRQGQEQQNQDETPHVCHHMIAFRFPGMQANTVDPGTFMTSAKLV